MEMLGQFSSGEQFEDGVTEESLPAGLEDSLGGIREEANVGVKKASLSGIDEVPHIGRNSLFG